MAATDASEPQAALAVILYGYDDWWLALPRSGADASSDVRTCNWLYAVTPAPTSATATAEGTAEGGGGSEPFAYALKERVKVVASSCFLADVAVVRTGKNTFTLSREEKERVDAAFSARVAAEAAELQQEAAAAAAAASAAAVVGAKRPREESAVEVHVVGSLPSQEEVAAPPPPPTPVMASARAPAVPCMVAIVISLAARDCIFGSFGGAEGASECRMHMAYWDPHAAGCRLVERATNPAALRPDGSDADVMLHVFGPLLREGTDFIFLSSDDASSEAVASGADTDGAVAGRGKGSRSKAKALPVGAKPQLPLPSSLPVAIAADGVAAFELRFDDAKVLEARRREDFARRQELASLPPPAVPTLVSIGGDHWAFSGAIAPPPSLPQRPRGLITPAQVAAQQPGGSGDSPFYHFIHDGVVHSVPVAAWNKKVSEVSATRFCRNTAKEAELSAKGLFLLLSQLRAGAVQKV